MQSNKVFLKTDKMNNSVETNQASCKNERGSAVIIALLVMILLMGFVALAITRTTNETIAASNDAAETRTFEAAHASLEIVTQNFDKIFDNKLNPSPSDLTDIEAKKPKDGAIDPAFFANYDFTQDINQTKNSSIVSMTGEEFQGLSAFRDEWQIDSVAKDKSSGVEVALRRRLYNNRIPIFQFGIFYEDDLEFHPGPRFDFGGRVHSNDNLFLMANTGLYFSSKVTTVSEVYTDVARNGFDASKWNENVFVKNASGNNVQLKKNMGSVLKTPVVGSPAPKSSDQPTTYKNANWDSISELFQGNLKSHATSLELPIRISSKINGQTVDYIELIRRGRNIGDLYNDGTGTTINPKIVPVTAANADGNITSTERYYNKPGIRISLADSKAKLPGCASGTGTNAVTTDCGILLNGHPDGKTLIPGSNPRGYKPRAMKDGYQATEINGERFFVDGREIWIKVETVGKNASTNVLETKDITQDFLSLGITDAPPLAFGMGNKDTRSVIKLQRFAIEGESMSAISTDDAKYITSTGTFFTNVYNIVVAEIDFPYPINDLVASDLPHARNLGITSTKIAPFPINMFDTREGLYYEGTSTFNPTSSSNYNKKVPWAGVMSMVDIDVANLKRFFDGDFNTNMPNGTPYADAKGSALKAVDVPDANGWVVYVSDRRGDFDFDGEYDMEDVYGNNDNIKQPGEDINKNGKLDSDTTNEAPRYTGTNAAQVASYAAVFEHKFYRRGVRLINGEKLPGKYDAVTPANTQGFTFASENGVYVLGNYNANNIVSVGEPTPSVDYRPIDHIPASIAADAVTILSNSWSDAKSFRYPFDLNNRQASETYVRFAMLAGDTLSSANGTPNQGGGDTRLSGGVHNFKRFLEKWGGVRLNYAGSLINLFNSHNNNGTFKCCAAIYGPPTRNWVFDTSFLDPNRLPPGTPFFQTIQLTGFERLD